jgi:hypothetical protein
VALEFCATKEPEASSRHWKLRREDEFFRKCDLAICVEDVYLLRTYSRVVFFFLACHDGETQARGVIQKFSTLSFQKKNSSASGCS